ncbi:hypothetical protein BWL13_02198 [Microbacterium oleivorans]|uniref:Acetyltransferase n=3 Tax=Microbacterium oleivorans TaxID=273677 RepID=A0A031FN73_9MICO|nr:hypothetical protein BWL13_02198 [Microbacterium oleivorans]EZP26048.1 Acetyltransferase [Microbacterium oleivorans]
MYHYTARRHTQWEAPTIETFPFVSQFSAYGFMGVQLFFLISGFVILMSVEGRSVGEFVAARISRLFPAYWAAVILTAILIEFIAGDQLGKSVTLVQVLTNLTMLQQWTGVPHVDGVYWTLAVELLFYVLIGIFMSTKLTVEKITWLAFLWPLAALIADRSNMQFLATFLSPAYAPLFAAGMMLYVIYSRGSNLLRWMLVVGNGILGTQQTIMYDVANAERLTGVDLKEPVAVAIMILIFASVALVTLSPLQSRGLAWMTYLGALTYPLYLVHELWGWWVIGQLSPYLNEWVVLVLAIAFVLLLAAAIERWVERRSRRWLRTQVLRSFPRAERAPAAAAAR